MYVDSIVSCIFQCQKISHHSHKGGCTVKNGAGKQINNKSDVCGEYLQCTLEPVEMNQGSSGYKRTNKRIESDEWSEPDGL